MSRQGAHRLTSVAGAPAPRPTTCNAPAFNLYGHAPPHDETEQAIERTDMHASPN